jgi:hypothetical protein
MMKTAEGEMPKSDPVIEELLHIYMDLQLRHHVLLEEASLAANAEPAIHAATGVAMSIVRVMSSLQARGYTFPE